MSKLTKEQREALVKTHTAEKLRILEVPTSETHSEFFEVAALIPDRNVMGQYMKWSDQNPKKAQEILVRGCILTDRERIELDDFLFNTTVSLLADLIPIGQGRIKKF